MAWADLVKLPQAAALKTFGQAVTFEPEGGAPVSVAPSGEPLTGVFRSAHVGIDLSTGAQVSSNEPMLDVRLSDLPQPPQANKDYFVVAGQRWIVKDVQRDGEGMVSVMLGGVKRLD